jgi:hypothetical protein
MRLQFAERLLDRVKVNRIRQQMKGVTSWQQSNYNRKISRVCTVELFAEYGTRALWNKHALEAPTPEDALVIARALRIEGNREARQLAERMERACRAAI